MLDASGQPKIPVKPCGATVLTLVPRDEGGRRPDFAEFRRALQDAVARKDAAAVLRVVDPGMRTDFDGSGGRDDFARRIADASQDFWDVFGRTIALGGRFRTPAQFASPYVYADWPGEADSFECAAVIGRGVRVRTAPRADAPVLTGLTYAIVQWVPPHTGNREWRRVRLADGRRGYMASRFLRSPVDYRAFFELKDGRWWLTAFVAGD